MFASAPRDTKDRPFRAAIQPSSALPVFIEFVPSFNPLIILSEGKDLCSFLAPGKVHRSPSTTLRAGFRVAQDDK